MKSEVTGNSLLGLDIGANSVGWAVLRASEKAEYGADALLAAGVRVFEAGVEGDLDRGREESRGVQRRTARGARRRLDRLARRLDKLFGLLRGAGLLPAAPPQTCLVSPPEGADSTAAALRRQQRLRRAQDRNRTLSRLDKEIETRWVHKLRAAGAGEDDIRLLPQRLPYVLRGKALDQRLEPHELGRALYHLAQRRGFLSNRKAAPKEDEKKGDVAKGISKIRAAMAQSGARTLGEYFARLNPTEQRIRARWTAREDYEKEFDAIWAKQATFHPDVLTEEFLKQMRRAILYQRPLKLQKNLIADCEFEEGRKRAPMALLAAQRFRLLQQVNNTHLRAPDGEERPLTPEEAGTLIHALENKGEMKFSAAKKLLHVPSNHVFNFEEGGETRFFGNRTAARLAEIFAERWRDLTPPQRDAVVDEMLSTHKDSTLKKRAMSAWKLDEGAAEKLSRLPLEPGYCRLSRQALAKLLPLMELGTPYATAVKEVYSDRPPAPTCDILPPVSEALPELRNPAVHRALTELRKVVNAIVRTYGKPEMIRVELARDLRKNREQRQRISKRNQENRAGREGARTVLLEGLGHEPKGSDIEKWLLWQECGELCPYTGRPIGFNALFGPQPQFDVEHIIPLSRSLDDSFLNKTLCENEENRRRKGNRTPWEAYGDTPQWAEIIQRVSRFQGSATREKLRRFQIKAVDPLEDFASQQLNDTRYASLEAVKHLGLLYGERPRAEAGTHPHVQAARGGVTAFLRNEWQLNSILGDGPGKSREDHRHHAVDAVCIALTSPSTVKALSDAAKNARAEGRRRFSRFAPPWPSFLADVRAAVGRIVVSHRVSRKVSGPLHEETFYSPPKKDAEGRDCVHVRKPLEALSTQDLEAIVDPAIREAVCSRLTQLGGGDPAKAFKAPENHPVLKAKDGRETPIHRVRVRKYQSTFDVGDGEGQRHVGTASNHHVEILEVRDRNGKPKWEGRVVDCYEALRRLRHGEPVVRLDHGPGSKFLFSLGGGENVLMRYRSDAPQLFSVSVISESGLEFHRNADARPDKVLRAIKGARVRASVDTLRQCGAQKVVVTPAGLVRRVGRE